MKLEGRRESTNVEDRRGKRAVATAGGVGLGGLILYFVLKSFLGVDISPMLEQQQQGASTEYVDEQDYSQVDQELMTFCKRILAGTEDVWDREFKKMGRTYQPPKMVSFAGAVSSGCGSARALTNSTCSCSTSRNTRRPRGRKTPRRTSRRFCIPTTRRRPAS